MSLCKSFAPVFAPDARALIVGSMPGAESLRAGQYYAYKQNAFWRIQCALWEVPFRDDYGHRLSWLTAHGLALWDVAACCDREGSLDTHMRNIEINDFTSLFAAAPGIARVFCNGGTAHALYVRNVQPRFPDRIPIRLPSTSPAHTMSFDHKLAAWRIIKEYLA